TAPCASFVKRQHLQRTEACAVRAPQPEGLRPVGQLHLSDVSRPYDTLAARYLDFEAGRIDAVFASERSAPALKRTRAATRLRPPLAWHVRGQSVQFLQPRDFARLPTGPALGRSCSSKHARMSRCELSIPSRTIS